MDLKPDVHKKSVLYSNQDRFRDDFFVSTWAISSHPAIEVQEQKQGNQRHEDVEDDCDFDISFQ